MDANDIVILLKHEITSLTASPTALRFESLDEKLHLPSGTAKKHLRDAAEKAGYEIVEEGETLAEIRKRPPSMSFRLERG